MSKGSQRLYLLITSLLIALLHVPVNFARSAVGIRTARPAIKIAIPEKSVYDSLQLQLKGMSRQAFDYAKKGMDALLQEGKLLNDSILSIIDFSLPSSEKRLFVINLNQYRILFNTLVAHGRNSGRERAEYFSNEEESFKSSPGFYITGTTYDGKNGYSLKLIGMESGVNDHAYGRGIVVHGADYVSQDYVNAQGFIGRSQGCPAVPVHICRSLINTIRNYSCMFIYYPGYERKSPLLKRAQF
jgi:hypothetical protein